MRTWAAIVALLSLLVHAGALVRQHGLVRGEHLLEQALSSGAIFCHGGQASTSQQPVHLPGNPKPSGTQNGCPICSGHAPAFALAAPEHLMLPVRFAVMARWCEPERVNPALRHAVCPPPRGPPAQALPA